MQKAMSFNNVVIVYSYRIDFWYVSKDDAINTMNGYSLVNKRVVFKDFFIMYKNEWVQLR